MIPKVIVKFFIAVLEDYSTDGSLSFKFTPANFERPQCFDISIEDDLACEDTETFSLNLLTEDSKVILKTSTLTVEILDNDSK